MIIRGQQQGEARGPFEKYWFGVDNHTDEIAEGDGFGSIVSCFDQLVENAKTNAAAAKKVEKETKKAAEAKETKEEERELIEVKQKKVSEDKERIDKICDFILKKLYSAMVQRILAMSLDEKIREREWGYWFSFVNHLAEGTFNHNGCPALYSSHKVLVSFATTCENFAAYCDEQTRYPLSQLIAHLNKKFGGDYEAVLKEVKIKFGKEIPARAREWWRGVNRLHSILKCTATEFPNLESRVVGQHGAMIGWLMLRNLLISAMKKKVAETNSALHRTKILSLIRVLRVKYHIGVIPPRFQRKWQEELQRRNPLCLELPCGAIDLRQLQLTAGVKEEEEENSANEPELSNINTETKEDPPKAETPAPPAEAIQPPEPEVTPAVAETAKTMAEKQLEAADPEAIVGELERSGKFSVRGRGKKDGKKHVKAAAKAARAAADSEA